MLENGGGFHPATGENPDVFPGVPEVVVGEFGDVERGVMLGCEEMICLVVIINEERHVAAHLSTFEVCTDEVVFFKIYVSAKFVCLFVRLGAGDGDGVFVFRRDVDRPLPGIGAEAAEELVRPGYVVRHGDAYPCGVILLPF